MKSVSTDSVLRRDGVKRRTRFGYRLTVMVICCRILGDVKRMGQATQGLSVPKTENDKIGATTVATVRLLEREARYVFP